MESLLHAEELALIPPTWSEKRKKTFVMGRLAAKQAMESYGTTTYPVLRGSMNEPLWPDTFKGSIAHKDNIAINLEHPLWNGCFLCIIIITLL